MEVDLREVVEIQKFRSAEGCPGKSVAQAYEEGGRKKKKHMQASRQGIGDWCDHWHPNRREDAPVMMACWMPPNPRSQAYAQSGTGLADAQRYAIGAAASLQEASNARGLSANATSFSSG